MTKASKVYTGYTSTLRSDLTDLVNYAVYDMCRETKSRDFSISLEELAKRDNHINGTALADFIAENSVPNYMVKFFMINSCQYDFTIDGKNRNEFDFDVSDEIAKSHVDDYEIAKDEIYGW